MYLSAVSENAKQMFHRIFDAPMKETMSARKTLYDEMKEAKLQVYVTAIRSPWPYTHGFHVTDL